MMIFFVFVCSKIVKYNFLDGSQYRERALQADPCTQDKEHHEQQKEKSDFQI